MTNGCVTRGWYVLFKISYMNKMDFSWF